MKFVELKKNIVSGNLYNCYNLCGDDTFLISSAEKLFLNYVALNNDLNKSILSTENLEPNTLISHLNTTSFFGGNKIVVLKDLECSKSKALIDCILKYLKNPNPSTILVVCSDVPFVDFKKNTLSNLVYVDCNRLDEQMLKVWILSALKEKNATMNDGAMQKLLDYTNGYLSIISLEINKLINYANGKEISESDVELLVQKTLEFSVFELTENLGKGNGEKALQILNIMLNDKKSAPTVFSLIQSYFRRMFFSVISKGTNAQIAIDLGIKEFAVKKAKEHAGYFAKTTLKEIVELCSELDYKVKTSQITYLSAVNYLVMFILTNKK